MDYQSFEVILGFVNEEKTAENFEDVEMNGEDEEEEEVEENEKNGEI